jgi:hypothetical protein
MTHIIILHGLARSEPIRALLQSSLWEKCTSSSIQRLACEIFDIIDQLVRRARRRLGLFLRDCVRDRGVQLGSQWKVRNLLVMLLPEAARQRVHQPH